MDNDFYTDKIEAYLLNKLDLEDKIAFRQVFEKDPILKSELQFQEQIIEAIQTNRKMELKARLDAIQIPQSLSPASAPFCLADGCYDISRSIASCCLHAV